MHYALWQWWDATSAQIILTALRVSTLAMSIIALLTFVLLVRQSWTIVINVLTLQSALLALLVTS